MTTPQPENLKLAARGVGKSYSIVLNSVSSGEMIVIDLKREIIGDSEVSPHDQEEAQGEKEG